MVRVGASENAFGRHWHAPSHSGASLRQFLDQVAAHGGQPIKLRTAGGDRAQRAVGVHASNTQCRARRLRLFNGCVRIAGTETPDRHRSGSRHGAGEAFIYVRPDPDPL